MAFKLSSIISTVLSFVAPIAGTAIAGKGAKYETLAQTAVKSAVTTVDSGLDKLKASFETFESSNEVVSQAVTAFTTLATTAGITVPSVDVIETHIKAAIYDLATVIVPSGQLPTPSAS